MTNQCFLLVLVALVPPIVSPDPSVQFSPVTATVSFADCRFLSLAEKSAIRSMGDGRQPAGARRAPRAAVRGPGWNDDRAADAGYPRWQLIAPIDNA